MEHRSGPFKSDMLNRITRTHIAIPVTVFLIYAICLMTYSALYLPLMIGSNIALFILGLLGFTLVEYLVHRFVYHPPGIREKSNNILVQGHGFHHDNPRDKSRLALPAWASVLIATIILFLLKFLLATYTFAFCSGFLSGYALYLTIHYVVHVFQPPRNIFRKLWINHSLHHHRDSNSYFGVTTHLWDIVFDTYPNHRRK